MDVESLLRSLRNKEVNPVRMTRCLQYNQSELNRQIMFIDKEY